MEPESLYIWVLPGIKTTKKGLHRTEYLNISPHTCKHDKELLPDTYEERQCNMTRKTSLKICG